MVEYFRLSRLKTNYKLLYLCVVKIFRVFNPFTATSSDALHNASKKTFYQITHTIHLLETIYKIIPYRPGKPKTFLD